MSTNNICFYGELTKILSFNYQQISSLSVLLRDLLSSSLFAQNELNTLEGP